MSLVTHKWDLFRKHTTIYRTLPDGIKLEADILVPPNQDYELALPVIIGALASGARNDHEFQTPWLADLALQSNAVLILPSYRLLPRNWGLDIRKDAESVIPWVQQNLISEVTRIDVKLNIDVDRILVYGASAGGFLAAHAALSYPKQIQAVVLVSPMLGGFQCIESGRNIKTANKARGVDQELKGWIEEQKSLPSCTSRLRDHDRVMVRRLLRDSMMYAEAFGAESGSEPIQRAFEDGMELPKAVYFLHGANDCIVSPTMSQHFVKHVQKTNSEVSIRFVVISGPDTNHGFEQHLTLDHPELLEGLDWVRSFWLS